MHQRFLSAIIGAVGLIVGILIATVATGVLSAQADRPIVAVQPQNQGRYQIVVSPHLQRETYLLDTQTGKTWKQIIYTDLENDPAVWEFQDRVDNLAELKVWWASHPSKKPEK